MQKRRTKLGGFAPLILIVLALATLTRADGLVLAAVLAVDYALSGGVGAASATAGGGEATSGGMGAASAGF